MKILHIIFSLGTGGSEKFTVELSNEQSKCNEVILCSVKNVEHWMSPPLKLTKPVKSVVFEIQKEYITNIFTKLYRILKQKNFRWL